MKKETKCVHSGTAADTVGRGLNTPIFPSSAHEYLDMEDVTYPRYFNTVNQKVIVKKICDLEGAEDGLVFSSGMAAISSVLLSLLGPGDHIVLQEEIYGGSYAFVEAFFERYGISYSFTATSVKAIESAIRPETKVVFIETPTNPLLSIIDIRGVAQASRSNNCITVIDNTFATPVNQNPVELGIDVVIHSGTKYLGGHSDLICGAVVTTSELTDTIRKTAINLGGNLNAMTCYLLERSLKTLSVRVKQQTDNALRIAEFLNDHPVVNRVNYPGLRNHPGHAVARDQMDGFGAMLSFELEDSKLSADDCMRRLNIITPAVSLGGVETTICDPVSTSHAKMTAETRAKQGITDGLLRLSVGIENASDLIEDLEQALEG